MFRMTSEENAKHYIAEWLGTHEGHEHSVKQLPYTISMECFDCGPEYHETIMIHETYQEARAELEEKRAASF